MRIPAVAESSVDIPVFEHGQGCARSRVRTEHPAGLMGRDPALRAHLPPAPESSCRVLVCLLDRVRQLDGMPAERIDEVESGHEHGLHA